jgi:hypothetical protein
MTTCPACQLVTSEVSSCPRRKIGRADGESRGRVPYFSAVNRPKLTQTLCPECGVRGNGIHHWGCTVEECPRCQGVIATCDCGWQVQ